MRGAFVICIAMIVVGVVLYIFELRHRRKVKAEGGAESSNAGISHSGAVATGVEAAEKATSDGTAGVDPASGEEGEECCGLHITCEKDTLSPLSDKIEYYDDEELDRFIGRGESDYTPEEVEEFRDVLMTLRGDDIPGWARSVTARRLTLPSEIRDELLILVNEQRELRNS